jgi:hypothetical protein
MTSKLTLAEQIEMDKIHSYKDGLMHYNTLAIYDYIHDKFTPRNKKRAFRKIISDNIYKDKNMPMNKYFYEITYLNYVIKDTIEKFRYVFPKTEVRKSNIDGLGLFAKEDIQKNKIITFYPVHYLLGDKLNYMSKFYLSNDIITSNLSMETFNVRDYILTGQEVELLAIGGHPKMYKDYENGHMINHSDDANSYFQLVNGDDNYLCNIWMIISTKDIKEGEEITVNYGPRWNKILK